MQFLTYWLNTAVLIARVIVAWEIAALCSLPLLITLAALPTHGVLRYLSAVCLLLAIASVILCFVVIDRLLSRADTLRP